MAELYFTLVINQKRTCAGDTGAIPQVPTAWRSAVAALLDARGYDLDGRQRIE